MCQSLEQAGIDNLIAFISEYSEMENFDRPYYKYVGGLKNESRMTPDEVQESFQRFLNSSIDIKCEADGESQMVQIGQSDPIKLTRHGAFVLVCANLAGDYAFLVVRDRYGYVIHYGMEDNRKVDYLETAHNESPLAWCCWCLDPDCPGSPKGDDDSCRRFTTIAKMNEASK